jgi:hypothetical protein
LLAHAKAAWRAPCRGRVAGNGLLWEDWDADIPVEGLLAGRGGVTVRRPVAA